MNACCPPLPAALVRRGHRGAAIVVKELAVLLYQNGRCVAAVVVV
jgi:hypothetical protein